jgi:hypothetical protein
MRLFGFCFFLHDSEAVRLNGANRILAIGAQPVQEGGRKQGGLDGGEPQAAESPGRNDAPEHAARSGLTPFHLFFFFLGKLTFFLFCRRW